MAKLLVTGANGQLGSDLKDCSGDARNLQFVFTDVDDLDITNYGQLDEFLKENPVDYIINCAAYTAVDKAEEEQETALLVNRDAVKNLAKAGMEHKARFIHISTDYVFDGEQNTPYKEEDPVNPRSVYGNTKLAGEQEAMAHPDHLIIRTSWLYSSHGNNFIKTMLRLGKEKEKLNVVFDQTGSPTYARDLAGAILKIVHSSEKDQNWKPGIYHYSNEGVCSWYDLAWEIMQNQHLPCKISPIETKDYPLPAKRPAYSVFNKNKIKSTFNLEIPHWRESLETCIKKIITS